MKLINGPCWQDAQLLNVKVGATNSYQSPILGSTMIEM
jgi:hypothetical protein